MSEDTKTGVKIHFLNVGIGDCTIVHFPARETKDGKKKAERIMVIDLYHHDDHEEYENVIEYYKQNFPDASGKPKPIFRFVCTHPHQDHICGISKLFNDNDIRIENIWDLDHSFEPENFDHHESHKEDWDTYKKNVDDKITSPKTIRLTRETKQGDFWNEDRITVLSPSAEMLYDVHSKKEDGSKRKAHEIDIDHISYALLMEINDLKIIFGGDGKEPCWNDIYKNCSEQIKDCDLLKAPHHGHKSAFHKEAVKLMKPSYVIFSNSVQEDKNEGAEKEYKNASSESKIFKTCEEGTIIANCSFDEKISLENNDGKSII